MKVSATPIPVAKANARSAAAAPVRTTPLPASTIGRSASRMIPSAERSSSGLGSGLRRPSRTGSGSASTGAAMTSSGSSMCVGPGFCAWAILNALRTTSGITRAEFSRALNFVTGRSMSTTSMY